MALVNLSQTGTPTGHVTPRGTRQPYMIEVFVTGADAVAQKGSALANADVLQILDIPAESLILGAGLEVITADTDGSADILMDVGIGGSVDVFVDGADPSTTGYKAAGTNGSLAFTNAERVTSADTLDIVLSEAASFSSNDDWKVRVYVVLLDVSGMPEAAAA